MKKQLPKSCIVDIVMGIIIQVIVICPWIHGTAGQYNIYMYLFQCFNGKSYIEQYQRIILEGMNSFPKGVEIAALCFFSACIVFVLAQLLGIIYILLAKGGKDLPRTPWMIISVIIAGIFLFFLEADAADWNIETSVVAHISPGYVQIYLLVFCMFILVWIIIRKAMEEWDEMSNRAKREKIQKKEYKKERKRRLRFPGKYSELYYNVLWKELKYRWRDVSYLFLCTFLSTTLLFVGIGLKGIFAGSYGEDQGILGLGLEEIMQNFMVIIVLISLFFITTILVFYRKKRLSNNGLYQVLGMRRSTYFVVWIGEVVICIAVGVIGGLIIGGVLLKLLCVAIENRLPELGALGETGVFAYISTVLGMTIICLFAYGFAHDIQLEKQTADARGAALRNEPIPSKYRYVGLVMGMIVMIYSAVRFGQRRTAENLWVLAIFFVGLFITIYNGGGIYLQCRKEKLSTYLKSLPDIHIVLYRYKTTIQYIMMFTIIHICVLFYFTTMVASIQLAEQQKNLYPYDYVLLANSGDKDTVEQLQKECDGEILTFPMVRVTTMDSTERLEPPPGRPVLQGQNIGISESTYRKLEILAGNTPKKNLGLDKEGKKIYVVYQQDMGTSSKPLDWYLWTKEPYIHIGQPLLEYKISAYRDIYAVRHIVGSETTSLIGCFKQGKYENIIVFSDQYFEQIKDNWKYTDSYTGEEVSSNKAILGENIIEGPTNLILVNIPDNMKKKANQVIEKFREIHSYDESFDPLVKSAYSKDQFLKQRKIERLLQESIAMIIWIVLLVMSTMLLHMKVKMELPEMKKRYRFMECFGMKRKERVKKEKKELSRFIIIPFIFAVPLSTLFISIILWMRRYRINDVVQFVKYGSLLWGIYFVVQIINLKVLQVFVVRKVEQNSEK